MWLSHSRSGMRLWMTRSIRVCVRASAAITTQQRLLPLLLPTPQMLLLFGAPSFLRRSLFLIVFGRWTSFKHERRAHATRRIIYYSSNGCTESPRRLQMCWRLRLFTSSSISRSAARLRGARAADAFASASSFPEISLSHSRKYSWIWRSLMPLNPDGRQCLEGKTR